MSFKDKFAIDDGVNGTGSFVYKADACMKRHNISREEMNLTNAESQRYLSFHRGMDWEEHALQANVSELLAQGCRPKSDETLEHFVIRNINKLECEL